MYAVVNHFPLKLPVDDALLDRMRAELLPEAGRDPHLRDFYFIRVSDEEAIVVVVFDSKEALERSTAEFAAPWFGANVGPYLSSPPNRAVGEVVVSTASR